MRTGYRPKTILVAGTMGFSQVDWWKPGSGFHQEGAKNGLEYVDPQDPFLWDTDIDGVLGENQVWIASGKSLLWYARAKGVAEGVNLIAHSHGGQVCAYAASFGLKVHSLITVATPVRADMQAVWKAALPDIQNWTHIYGGVRDYWQILGELRLGHLNILRREMPLATMNICEPERDHSGLLDPALWARRNWWRLTETLPGKVTLVD